MIRLDSAGVTLGERFHPQPDLVKTSPFLPCVMIFFLRERCSKEAVSIHFSRSQAERNFPVCIFRHIPQTLYLPPRTFFSKSLAPIVRDSPTPSSARPPFCFKFYLWSPVMDPQLLCARFWGGARFPGSFLIRPFRFPPNPPPASPTGFDPSTQPHPKTKQHNHQNSPPKTVRACLCATTSLMAKDECPFLSFWF